MAARQKKPSAKAKTSSKSGAKKPAAKKAPAKKAPAKKPAAKKAAAKKAPAKKPAAKKPAAKKAPAKKPAAKKAVAKKPAAKKAVAKKPVAKKAPAKKPAAKKPAPPAKKAAAAKPASKSAPALPAAELPAAPSSEAATAAAPGEETKETVTAAPAEPSAPPPPPAKVAPVLPPRPEPRPPPAVPPEKTGAVPAPVVRLAHSPASRLAAYVAVAAAASSREVDAEDVVDAFLTAPVDENEGWQPLPWAELAASGYGHRIVELLGERLRGYRWIAQVLALPLEERARVFAHLGDRVATKFVEGVEFLGRASEDLLSDLEEGFLARVFGLAAEMPDGEKARETLKNLVGHWRKRGLDLADDAADMLSST